MSDSLRSLIGCGTKLWLDSIDPELVEENRSLGATGATSNPIIIADLIKTGRFDHRLQELVAQGLSDEEIAWDMADQLVREAQVVFHDVHESTAGNDGYVSFELDPLIEDPELDMPHEERVAKYVQLAKHWSAGHVNRMIKVPATPAGVDALEEIVVAGIPVNVTLIFTDQQYRAARDACWRGAQRLGALDAFKSVYSIFVSRIDVYTQKQNPGLSQASQGMVGIVNAQRIWAENDAFWKEKGCPLQQEIIFASTGTKRPEDEPWKYVAALAGSDIQTNPPKTNQAVAESTELFTRRVDQLPAQQILDEIDDQIDFPQMHKTLMSEGIAKFADPQKQLIALLSERRAAMAGA
ncbi:MAG: transaldolase family protein [Planctomycetota bacterium]|nr:transaldolase family protein [Planctomycetota bacterium]